MAGPAPLGGSSNIPRDPHGQRLAAEPRAGDFALPAPIDQRAFRRPLGPTNSVLQAAFVRSHLILRLCLRTCSGQYCSHPV